MSRHVRRSNRGPSLATLQRRSRTRRVLAFGGMLAAVGGLVTARGAVAPAPSQALATTGLAAPVSQGASTPSSQPATPKHHRHHRHHHAAGSSATTTTSPSPAARPTHHKPVRHTITGDPFNVGYGTVQVRIVLVGHHLSDVTAISLPSGGHSSDVSSYAAPRLRQEALAAQSARIDTVSGASYTSAGYAKSLQSALDKGATLS
jgi:uncharacterized protein with FMN-binding domain